MEWYWIAAIAGGCVLLFLLIMLACAIYLSSITLRPRVLSDQAQIKRQRDRDHINLSDYDSWHKQPFMLETNGATILGQYVYNPVKSNKWAIISHGFTSAYLESYKYASIFYDFGYNLVMYDQRYFGDSTGKCCTMGYYESRDLVNIINMLKAHEGDDLYVAVHGESMGAVTVLSALELTDDIDVVVADCGFNDTMRYYRKHLVDMFKVNLSFPLVDFSRMCSGIYCKGYDFKKVSPIRSVAKSDVPILFVHGTADTFIPRENSISMFNVCKNPLSRIYLAVDGIHAGSYCINPYEYRRVLADFLNSVYEAADMSDRLTVPATLDTLDNFNDGQAESAQLAQADTLEQNA